MRRRLRAAANGEAAEWPLTITSTCVLRRLWRCCTGRLVVHFDGHRYFVFGIASSVFGTRREPCWLEANILILISSFKGQAVS